MRAVASFDSVTSRWSNHEWQAHLQHLGEEQIAVMLQRNIGSMLVFKPWKTKHGVVGPWVDATGKPNWTPRPMFLHCAFLVRLTR